MGYVVENPENVTELRKVKEGRKLSVNWDLGEKRVVVCELL